MLSSRSRSSGAERASDRHDGAGDEGAEERMDADDLGDERRRQQHHQNDRDALLAEGVAHPVRVEHALQEGPADEDHQQHEHHRQRHDRQQRLPRRRPQS